MSIHRYLKVIIFLLFSSISWSMEQKTASCQELISQTKNLINEYKRYFEPNNDLSMTYGDLGNLYEVSALKHTLLGQIHLNCAQLEKKRAEYNPYPEFSDLLIETVEYNAITNVINEFTSLKNR